MQKVEIFNRNLKICQLKVEEEQGEVLIKFKNILNEESLSLIEQTLLEQNINCNKIKGEESENHLQDIEVKHKLKHSLAQRKSESNIRENAYYCQRYLQVARLKEMILCRELFFSDFAILLPKSFFLPMELIQVSEFIQILCVDEKLGEKIQRQKDHYMIVNEYDYCINICRTEFLNYCINWKNIKQTTASIDQHQPLTDDHTLSIIVDYIKSPFLVQKIIASLNENIRFLRLNTCVLSKFDQILANKYLKFLENLELISLNQEQYVFSTSRLKGLQINQIQTHLVGLRRLVLEDIFVDCMRANKIEELTIINNSSDMFYLDLDSTCVLHTLIVQRCNSLQITEMKHLGSLQKLVLFDVDILEKELQQMLDSAPNLKYLKLKSVHFINWQFYIKNEHLEYISLDSLEFEQDLGDIFQLNEYPQVKYFAFINCRIGTNYTLSCFNKFKNVVEFTLLDKTLGEHTKLDLSLLDRLKDLTISCKQCKLHLHDEIQLETFNFEETCIVNLEKIFNQSGQHLKAIQIHQPANSTQIINSNFLVNLQKLNLSKSKLGGVQDLSQIVQNSRELREIDISNNQITHIKLVCENRDFNKLDLAYNLIEQIEIQIKSVTTLYLNNNLLNKIDKIKAEEINQLNLHKNQITDISEIYQYINRVAILDISDNKLEILSILSPCQLQYLDSRNNKIQKIQLIGTIQVLDLSQNELNQLNEEGDNILRVESLKVKKNMLKQIPTLSHSHLKHLDISNNQIFALKTNLAYPQLKELNLNSNKISSCDTLFESHNFPELETLQISQNLIESIEFQENNLSKLKSLNLSKNAIDSCDPLFKFPSILERINLSFNNIIYLTRYQINPDNQIKELHLKKNAMTDSSLTKLNNLHRLEILDISMNLFTERIKFTHQCKSLRSLSIALNNIMNEGVESIFENVQSSFPVLEEIDIMHTQGNKLPMIQSSTINYIYQENSLFFDNLDENKQLYLKGILFQQ